MSHNPIDLANILVGGKPTSPAGTSPIGTGGLPGSIISTPGCFCLNEVGDIVDCDDPTAVTIFCPPPPEIPEPEPPTNEPPTTTTTPVPGGGIANITIQNQINLSSAALQAITDAVNNGVEQAISAVDDKLEVIIRGVDNAVKGTVDAIGNAASNLFGGLQNIIGQIIDYIKNNIGNIISTIVNNIGPILQKIGDTLVAALKDLPSIIDGITKEVNDIYSNIIQPITNVILQTIQTVGTLTAVIEKDLHDGITGLLQLPGDIASGLTSLDATIDRSIEQLKNNTAGIVDVNLKNAMEDSIGNNLKSLGVLLTQQQEQQVKNTVYTDGVKLPEPDITQAVNQNIAAIWQEIAGVLNSVFNSGKGVLDGLENNLPLLSPILGITAAASTVPVAIASMFVAAFLPFLYFLKDDISAKTGLAKLNPGDALEAFRRGFIDATNLQSELSFQGWDAQRIQVLKDLQNTLIDTAQALDMNFRGIMSTNDLTETLREHGFDPGQQQALIEAAFHVFDISTARTAYLQGRLTQDELSGVLKINRYTDNEIATYIATAARPINAGEYLQFVNRGFVEGRFLSSDPNYNAISDSYLAAAHSQGLDVDTAINLWHAQFDVQPLQHWISLYFRGIRTLTELNAVFDYYRVPTALRDDVIRVHQSLIPWRTIPTMLSKGIITEPYAKQQLAAHGFDETAQVALLNYAAATHASTKATASGNLQATSVSVARQLWDIGALTDDQYEKVLQAHGYTVQDAALVVQAEKAQLMAKERKQLGTDIENEFLSGLITLDQANQQMAANNFSEAEKARVLRSINRQQRQTSKTPGEAEMRKMLEKAAITLDDYKQGLSVLGYSDKWVTAFVNTYFGSLNGSTTTA